MKRTILAIGSVLILTAATVAAQNPAPAAAAAKPATVVGPKAPAVDPALKADPATVEDVAKFAAILQFDKNFSRSVAMIPDVIKRDISADLHHTKKEITEAEIAKGEAAAQPVIDATAKKLDYHQILTAKLAPLFQQHFTHTEMVAITQFFGTPAGNKLLANFAIPFNQAQMILQNEFRKEIPPADKDAKVAARRALGLPDTDPKPAPAVAKKPATAPTTPAAPAKTDTK
jgi:hypothetical protein